ncbi:MAG TPA: hypothetical protein VHB21_19500 [Minicystis sp.]|nr:hypothetical protein [Minicystis sp.]
MLDGVCVKEAIADYVACVRAQGAQLGEDKGKHLSVEAGQFGVKASAVADLKDTLQRKYAVSDANTLEIIKTCGAVAGAPAAKKFSGFQQFYKCSADAPSLGDKPTKEACLAACQTDATATGCWYLDGTGGFPRDCRVCHAPMTKQQYANDWGGTLE